MQTIKIRKAEFERTTNTTGVSDGEQTLIAFAKKASAMRLTHQIDGEEFIIFVFQQP